MALPNDIDDWDKVESLTDFVAFLKILELDVLRDLKRVEIKEAEGWKDVEGEWVHPSLDGYFEQFAGYLADHFLSGEDERRIAGWAPAVVASHADPAAPPEPYDADDGRERAEARSEEALRGLDFRTVAWMMSRCRHYE